MFKLSAGLSLEDDASDSDTDSSEYETGSEDLGDMELGIGGMGGEIEKAEGGGGAGGEMMVIDEE